MRVKWDSVPRALANPELGHIYREDYTELHTPHRSDQPQASGSLSAMLLKDSWSGHGTGTGTGQEHPKKRKPAPSQDWQTPGWWVSMVAVEVTKPHAHCTAKQTFSETMGDMPEVTLQVCDCIWTREHIFQCLLSMARLPSRILTCV